MYDRDPRWRAHTLRIAFLIEFDLLAGIIAKWATQPNAPTDYLLLELRLPTNHLMH